MVGTMWDWDDMKGLTVFMAIMARLAGRQFPALSLQALDALDGHWYFVVHIGVHSFEMFCNERLNLLMAEFEDDAMLPRFMGYGLTQLNGCNILVECVKREVEMTSSDLIWALTVSSCNQPFARHMCQRGMKIFRKPEEECLVSNGFKRNVMRLRFSMNM